MNSLYEYTKEIGSCSFNDCMSWRKNRFITTRKIDIQLLHRRGKKRYQALVETQTNDYRYI